MNNFVEKLELTMIETYPGVVGYERVWSSGRCSIRREEVWFTDEGIVAFIVDSGMDEPTVHTPGTISCRKQNSTTQLKKH